MLTAATGVEDHSLAPLTHAVPDLMDVRQAIDAVLAEFLAAKRRSARPTTRELIDTLRAFLLAGGKRIRPTLVGRPDLTEEQADAVRAVLEATGARLRRAPAALDRAPFPESATAPLRQLAYATSARRS
ncbi:hypothetical protein OHT93_36025 [Streptomyces sp. NBC_00191]|uniref:hypothetical protein n=1 Tax=Streptomyces sp. NBC_00191 TaxID=2975674 RepID=UPI003249E0B8